MPMTLVKNTDEYSIYKRRDNRYAVKDAAKNAVNGEEKVKVLVAEGLVEIKLPAPPAEETAAADAPAEEATAEEAPAAEEEAKEE